MLFRSGWSNDCEEMFITQDEVSPNVFSIDKRIEFRTKDEVIHAEANAISKLARSNDSGLGSDMFISHAPCVHCAKLIYGAGISKVYYRNSYRDTDGIDFLTKCNIEVEKV